MDLVTITTLAVVFLVWKWYMSREVPGKVNAIMKYKTVRELDSVEELFVKFELNHALSQTHCISLYGPITPQLLREALVSMQQRHQCLRLGIHQTGYKYYFHEYDYPEEKIDISEKKRLDSLHWKAAMINRNNNYRSVVSNDKLLWKILLLQNESPNGPHEIILESFHAIIDGNSRIIFTRILLETLACLAENKPIPKEYFPLQKPHHELLFSKGQNSHYIPFYYFWLPNVFHMVRASIHLLMDPKSKVLFNWQHTDIKNRSTAFYNFKLSKETTQAFLKICKEHNVTFNSGFLGISLMAAQKVWKIKQDEELTIGLPIRMSSACSPPITTKHLSNMISATTLKLKYPHESQETISWSIATQFQDLVHKTPIMGKAIAEAYDWSFVPKVIDLAAPYIMFTPEGGRLSNIMCSNTGSWDFPLQHGEFRLNGWFAVHKETLVGSNLTHFMATIGGECCVTTQFVSPCMSANDVFRYTEIICQEISELTNIPNGIILDK